MTLEIDLTHLRFARTKERDALLGLIKLHAGTLEFSGVYPHYSMDTRGAVLSRVGIEQDVSLCLRDAHDRFTLDYVRPVRGFAITAVTCDIFESGLGIWIPVYDQLRMYPIDEYSLVRSVQMRKCTKLRKRVVRERSKIEKLWVPALVLIDNVYGDLYDTGGVYSHMLAVPHYSEFRADGYLRRELACIVCELHTVDYVEDCRLLRDKIARTPVKSWRFDCMDKKPMKELYGKHGDVYCATKLLFEAYDKALKRFWAVQRKSGRW